LTPGLVKLGEGGGGVNHSAPRLRAEVEALEAFRESVWDERQGSIPLIGTSCPIGLCAIAFRSIIQA